MHMINLRNSTGRFSSWLHYHGLHADIQAREDSAEASLAVIQDSLDKIVGPKLKENSL